LVFKNRILEKRKVWVNSEGPCMSSQEIKIDKWKYICPDLMGVAQFWRNSWMPRTVNVAMMTILFLSDNPLLDYF